MVEKSKLIHANNYYYISYPCVDGRLRYPTGISLKKAQETKYKEKLEDIQKYADDFVSKSILINSDITKEDLKNYIDNKLKRNRVSKSVRPLIDDHKEMIRQMRSGKLLTKKSKKRYSKNTIEQYKRMLDRWVECADDPESGFVLSYNMTINHVINLIKWLTSKGKAQNSIYDIINNLKIFLKYARESGFHDNDVYTHRDFNTAQEEPDNIAPTFEEILQLYKFNFELPGDTRNRDFFVFGCFLALRVGDLQRINDYKLNGNVFEVFTKKGSTKVSIPCHWIAREIYSKYNGNIPVCTRQNLARYIPVIFKKAGIKEEKLMTSTKGGVTTAKVYKRCDLFSPHSMRRFWATWMYVVVKRQPREIMKVTGHKSEAAFFRYIKIENEKNAANILNDPEFQRTS